MKGAFVKNWILLFSGMKFSLISFTVVQILIMFFGISIDLLIVPALVCSIILSLLEYSDKCKWQRYGDALPGGRENTVRGMYVFILAFTLAYAVLNTALYALILILFPQITSVSHLFAMPIAIIAVVFLTFGLTLPIMYKFGYIVFKTVYLMALGFSMGMVGGLMGVMAAKTEEVDFVLSIIATGNSIYEELIKVSPIILIGVLVLFDLSMLLSSKLYKSVDI